jgi:hypothetical protein
VLTDGDGRFEIPNLPVGPQAVQVLKPRFLDETYSLEAGLMGDSNASPHNVLVAAEMADVIFTLTPSSAIHGRIDLSTGEPAEGIHLTIARRVLEDGRSVWQLEQQVKTTSDGNYRFAGLPDGDYRICTEPQLESEPMAALSGLGSAADRAGYARVFYPDAREAAGAQKISVKGGQQVEANMTLTLEPFHKVAAQVVLPQGPSVGAGQPISQFLGLVMDAAGRQLAYQTQYDAQRQTMQAMLPDGGYSMLVTAVPQLKFGRGSGSGVRPEQETMVGMVEFAVSGHTVTNLRVPLVPSHMSPVDVLVLRSETSAAPGQTQGMVSATRNGAAMAAVMLSAASGGTDESVVTAYANGDLPGPLTAVFTLPGPYWVHTHSPAGYCEASFTAGGANLAREPVTIGLSGSAAPMELTLRQDCAGLNVSLPENLMTMAPGEEPFYTVYAVPDFDSTTDVVPMVVRTSTGGTSSLADFTPGSYHVYTIPGSAQLEYRNPNLLASLPSQSITLTPGVTTNLVLEVPQR